MKKIRILTFYWTVNFGGLLQAHALQEYLKKEGYDVEFINYHNKNDISKSIGFKKRVVHFVWDKLARFLFGRAKREKITQKFRNEELNISPHACHTIEKLIDIESKEPAYAYIVGSDQVWNPEITGKLEAYLFSFLNDNSKRISYAASFGRASLESKHQTTFKNEIVKFSAVSVREEDGAKLIEKLSGIDAEVVMDPVFLMPKEYWHRFACERIVKKDYILCYFMNTADKSIHIGIKKIANYLSNKYGLKIVNIGKREYERLRFWENNIFDIGPKEFVSLFKHASFVVTNSFHATAFSTIMNVPFLVPVNYNEDEKFRMSNRMENLVKNLGCEERIISCPINEDNICDKIDRLESMDFSTVESKKEVLVSKSKEFLDLALKGEDRI